VGVRGGSHSRTEWRVVTKVRRPPNRSTKKEGRDADASWNLGE